MILAPVIKDEFERLSTLLDYKILDSQPEIEYDDITQLASVICETPIALVSLIDENRQWFKSRVGVNLSELDRSTSFCGHAIQSTEVFVVKDSLKDKRFFDNPAVNGPMNVRFYAGAPLVAPNGHAVGTLCVVDHKARDLSPEQKKALQTLSRQVVNQLELRKAIAEMSQNYEELRSLSKKVHQQEQLLIETAKMSVIGEMAAGAAHEINNPLTIIAGRADQVRAEIARENIDVDKVESYAQAINENVIRIAKVVRALKTFTVRSEAVEKSRILLSGIVENMIALYAERTREAKIQLELDIHEDSEILASQLQVSQIFLNLLNNAFDAVKDVSPKWIRINVSRDKKYALASVLDSGAGVAEPIRNKIMDPFFTTKEDMKRTGLGLSVSKSLAEHEGGNLVLDTTAQNTCFTLTLPVAPEK